MSKKSKTVLTYSKAISKLTGLTAIQSKAATTALIDLLKADIEQGNKIALPGFGYFVLKYSAGRETRHKNGILYPAKPHYRLYFKPIYHYKMHLRTIPVNLHIDNQADTKVNNHSSR